MLFIYVTSLSSNEIFSTSNKLLILIRGLLIITFRLLLIVDLNYFSFIINYETILFNNLNIFINENNNNLNKLYNFPTNFITLFIINYLFLTLVIAVKITNFFYGPLRPSF